MDFVAPILPPSSSSPVGEWDDGLVVAADQIAEEEGVPIEYAYRLAQLRFGKHYEVATRTPMKHRQLYARFELGTIFATPAALVALVFNGLTPKALLLRHVTGDYGDLGPEDCRSNEEAIRRGSRILSAYTLVDGAKVYVITEWDRSATTLLLSDEY